MASWLGSFDPRSFLHYCYCLEVSLDVLCAFVPTGVRVSSWSWVPAAVAPRGVQSEG